MSGYVFELKLSGLQNLLEGLDSVGSRYVSIQKKFQGGIGLGSAYGQNLKDSSKNLENRFQGFGLFSDNIERIASSMQPLIDKTVAYDEALADMSKTTGLSSAESEKLSASLANIDTRTKQVDLIGIAEVGGQLNVPKEELESFTQSIDKAVVALGKDFGGNAETVATKLGTIKNLFNETRNEDYGSSMLKVGSALNALGDAGTATADVVAEFTTRMGQLGKLGPGLKENLAFGAILQESGLSAEVASGGLSNLLLVASQNSEKFAKAMNITNQEFSDLLGKDPAKFLLSFAEKTKDLNEVQLGNLFKDLGVGSQESIKVFQSLSQNTDKYADKIKLVNSQFDNANSIQSEYDKKNNTIGARIEKLQKVFDSYAVSIGKSVAAYLPAIQGVGGLVSITSSIIPLLPLVGSLFGAMLGPVGLVAIGIGAIAGVFYYLYYNSTRVNGILNQLFASVTSQASLFSNQLGRVLGLASGIQGGFTFFEALELVFAGLGIYLRIFFDVLFLELNYAFSYLRIYLINPLLTLYDLIQSIGQIFAKVFQGDFSGALDVAYGFVVRFVDRITSAFKDAFGGIATGFMDIADTIGGTLGFEVGQKSVAGASTGKSDKEQMGVGDTFGGTLGFEVGQKSVAGASTGKSDKEQMGVGDTFGFDKINKAFETKDFFKKKKKKDEDELNTGLGLNLGLGKDTANISKGLEGVAGGGQKNVNVTVGNLVENMTLQNQKFEDNISQMEDRLLETLLKVLNGANQLA